MHVNRLMMRSKITGNETMESIVSGVWEHYQETVEGAYRNNCVVRDDILHVRNVKEMKFIYS